MKKTIDVANVLLQNNLEEVLLLQRALRLKRPLVWGLPGGMIDAEETALDAATRELAEESSIKDSDIAIRGIMKFLVQMPDENVRITNVRALLLDNNTQISIDPDEHVAYRWVNPEDIYTSSDLLPCVPTMVARALGSEKPITDLTITPDMQVTIL